MRMTTAVTFAATLTCTVCLGGQEPARPRPAALAQEAAAPAMNTPRHAAAMAAASRALHYCTGLFTAGMSLEQIAATDRSDAAAATMKTDIDRVGKTVSVTYLPDMTPRIAAWRPSLGCAQLPIGATMDMVKHLPRLPASVKPPDFDARAWPMGDADATVALPGSAEGRARARGGQGLRRPDLPRQHVGRRRHQGRQDRRRALRGRVQPAHARADQLDVQEPRGHRGRRGGEEGAGRHSQEGAARRVATAGRPARPDHDQRFAAHGERSLYRGRGRSAAGALHRGARQPRSDRPSTSSTRRRATRFVYAGSDTILSVRAVRQAINDDAGSGRFPFEEILWKIGMTRTYPETDWNGDFMMSGQCWSTARDFGRFGLLYINDGVWNGERILPEGWAKYVATPSPANPAYGAQFWVLRRTQRASRRRLQSERCRRSVRHDRALEGRHRRPSRASTADRGSTSRSSRPTSSRRSSGEPGGHRRVAHGDGDVMRKERFATGAVIIALSSFVALAQTGQPPARFGIGPPPSSAELAARPQTPGGKGDQQRHYYFAAAGKEMPYHLYVPQSYDPAVATPLVVALHGFGGNQDYFFASVRELPALCEKYGVIFAAPMGLATDGWYGAPLSIPGSAPRSSGAAPPPQVRTPDEEVRYRALSEADVMNVLGIVRKEYHVDSNRIYLMGHSMGGFGAWWLGQKYADTWAALAPMSGVLPDVDYQLDKLSHVPVHISIGGAETPAWVEASRLLAGTMRARGMVVAYAEPAAETHGSMIAPTTPQVLEFFSKHTRGTRGK